MANERKVMGSIKNFLEKMKALDTAIPEELADDALEMVEGVKDALCEDEEEVIEEKEENIEKKVEDAVGKALMKLGLIKDSSMKSLDECMKETEDEEEEEEIKIEDENSEEEVTVDPEKVKDNGAELRKQLSKIKPIIASISNPSERKKASDAIASIIKLSKGNQYGDILHVSRTAANDAKKNNTVVNDSDFDLGKNWAQKFNPHYMKEGK